MAHVWSTGGRQQLVFLDQQVILRRQIVTPLSGQLEAGVRVPLSEPRVQLMSRFATALAQPCADKLAQLPVQGPEHLALELESSVRQIFHRASRLCPCCSLPLWKHTGPVAVPDACLTSSSSPAEGSSSPLSQTCCTALAPSHACATRLWQAGTGTLQAVGS